MSEIGTLSCPSDLVTARTETQEPEKKFKETNIMYARSLYQSDLPLINRVVNNHINSVVGADAPLWKKESAYNQWCDELFDERKWARARLEMSAKYFVFG